MGLAQYQNERISNCEAAASELLDGLVALMDSINDTIAQGDPNKLTREQPGIVTAFVVGGAVTIVLPVIEALHEALAGAREAAQG